MKVFHFENLTESVWQRNHCIVPLHGLIILPEMPYSLVSFCTFAGKKVYGIH